MSKHENTGPSRRFETFRLRIVQPASFFLVLGICQPTKVRRQLLWSIETEHEGKAMIIMMVVMMIKLHMLMMM